MKTLLALATSALLAGCSPGPALMTSYSQYDYDAVKYAGGPALPSAECQYRAIAAGAGVGHGLFGGIEQVATQNQVYRACVAAGY